MARWEKKSFAMVECKTKAETPGTFTGYASTYAKDAYGDRILPGAFAQSIKDQRGKIPILFNHRSDSLVGFSTDLAEDTKGLYIDASLALGTATGADVYALMQLAEKVDFRMGLSIGFYTLEAELADDGGRLIKSVDLVETSITATPANNGARVESVKSKRAIERILRDVGSCSLESSKRVLALLNPYLSPDEDEDEDDGEPLPELARDVREWRQHIQFRNTVRTALSQLKGTQ
jgi:HK97 family phage prohead protease